MIKALQIQARSDAKHVAELRSKLVLEAQAARYNADIGDQLKARALDAEVQRDEFAAALSFAADELRRLGYTGSILDSSAILARVKREAKAGCLEMWANWLQSGAVSAEQSIPDALRSYAAALRRREEPAS